MQKLKQERTKHKNRYVKRMEVLEKIKQREQRNEKDGQRCTGVWSEMEVQMDDGELLFPP